MQNDTFHAAAACSLKLTSSRVDLSPVGEEELDDVGVAARGCKRQRRVVGDVAVLLVGAARQQNLNNLETEIFEFLRLKQRKGLYLDN